MSDIFRLVDEDLKKERLMQIWKNYSIYIISFLILLIFFSVGYQFYKSYNQSINEQIVIDYIKTNNFENSDKFLEKIELIENNSNQLITALTKLRISDHFAEIGKDDEAERKLLEIIESEVFNDTMREHALYNYIMLNIDTLEVKEIEKYIAKYSNENSNLKPLFSELLAIKYLLSGKDIESKELFKNLINNPITNSYIKLRAEKFITILENV